MRGEEAGFDFNEQMIFGAEGNSPAKMPQIAGVPPITHIQHATGGLQAGAHDGKRAFAAEDIQVIKTAHARLRPRMRCQRGTFNEGQVGQAGFQACEEFAGNFRGLRGKPGLAKSDCLQALGQFRNPGEQQPLHPVASRPFAKGLRAGGVKRQRGVFGQSMCPTKCRPADIQTSIHSFFYAS